MLFFTILLAFLGVSVGLVFLTLSLLFNYCLFFSLMGYLHGSPQARQQSPDLARQLNTPNTDGRRGPINRPTGTQRTQQASER